MKKYIFIIFLLAPFNVKTQCNFQTPNCGFQNTSFVFPKITNQWIKQNFSSENSGILSSIQIYVGSSAVSDQLMEVVISSNGQVLFVDTLTLPSVGNSFIVCDILNWSYIFPNIAITAGEIYTVQITQISLENNQPVLVYGVNENLFNFGSCINDLNESGIEPDVNDPNLLDPLLPNQDCAFIVDIMCPCLGDYDQDGFRSVSDLVILMSSFGSNSSEINLVGDENITTEDLLFFIGIYGTPCP